MPTSVRTKFNFKRSPVFTLDRTILVSKKGKYIDVKKMHKKNRIPNKKKIF